MELKKYPNLILRAKCRPVLEITNEDIVQAKEMLEFMYAVNGAGLAGPQVGWNRQILTLDVGGERQGERVFVNPRIISSEGEVEAEEGCLSLPGLWAPVKRAEKLVVVAYTLAGERVEQHAEGLLARAWQHEIDHLNGMLFIDRLAPTTLMTLRQKLRELELDQKESESK